MALAYELPGINQEMADDLHRLVELRKVDLPMALAGVLTQVDIGAVVDFDRGYRPLQEARRAGQEALENLLPAARALRDVKPGSAGSLERERAGLESFVTHSVGELGGRVVQYNTTGREVSWQAAHTSDPRAMVMGVGRLAGFSLQRQDEAPITAQSPRIVHRLSYARRGAFRTLHHLLHISDALTTLESRESQPANPYDALELQQFWREKGSHFQLEKGGPRVLAAEYLARLTEQLGANIVTASPKGDK